MPDWPRISAASSMVGPGGVKDYSAFQEIILQFVEAIVATRRCLVRYQAPGRSKPNGFRFDPYRLLAIQGLLYW